MFSEPAIQPDFFHPYLTAVLGAYCLGMHAHERRKGGESWQCLNVLSVWWQTDAFTAKEQAAMEWAETSTRVPDGYAERELE